MRRLATVTMIVALAVGAAACGSSSSNASTDTTRAAAGSSTTAGGSAPAGTTELKVADSSLGTIVVDGEGRTLYLFTADQGTTSACTGGCASAWPALVAPATASSEITGTLGKAMQAGGDEQVTLNGHLLYYYAADAAPGATSGQGVGGKWFVVDPSGNAIEKAPAGGSGY
jgi:predicted lipoprotein with Yx(FWY)xxD motif